MKTLDFVEVPKTFELCNRTECPMAGSCLRRRAWDALPPMVDKVTIVNPACTTASADCRWYRSDAPVKYGRGLLSAQANMLPGQYDRFSAMLISHFGRNSYFERRRGDRLCTPQDMKYIRRVLASLGLEHLDFDDYTECYNWFDE